MNKKTILILILSMMVFPNLPCRAEQSVGANNNSPDLVDLLPSFTTKVSLMTLIFTEKDESIAAKVQLARESDPEWFHQYILSREIPGEPLPYHEKLGVKEKEYEYFLSSAERATFKEFGKAELKVKRDSVARTVILDLDIPESLFRNITFFLDFYKVKTPLGDLTKHEYVHQKEINSPLGQWKGFSWHLEEGTIESGHATSVRLAIGQVLANQKTFIEYRVSALQDGVLQKRNDFLIMY